MIFTISSFLTLVFAASSLYAVTATSNSVPRSEDVQVGQLNRRDQRTTINDYEAVMFTYKVLSDGTV